ncbi:hypothetical protein [Microbacterium ulmi]|uniref:Uncharacterized protein n=1 Tax=Microbacterium ulmi TaxID=179095 RepID=A0A7Y2PZ26_9MICO|nr:hypothetical protein [Microbacterium ulmi]NII69387.1 hypothetical protein [Microbacterium ulmi]NNH04001.1 hypothetical protein [Microbacterium ulmi]
MKWTADVTDGDWIRERLDVPWRATMHDVVPHGFAAYARIFHPARRDRPVGDEWPGLPYAKHRREWDAFQARDPEIVDERVSWATTAVAMGTTMHTGAQWHRLVAPGRIVENEDGPRDAAGWRYGDPEQGDLAPDLVAVVAGHLAAHTTTPDDGRVALWEGFGALVGFFGESPSRVFFQIGAPESGELAHHNTMLGRSFRDRLNNVFRKPQWQDGILSREISEGPRLQLPGRDYLLFRGGVSELADPGWVLRMPWRDRIAEEHGFPPAAHSPSLVWPADRSWVLVTEVDYDSTIVGGRPELIRALCSDPRLEALPVREGTALTWDADDVNR